MTGRIGIRWTIGDVSPEGFEALRLSIWGAWRLLGTTAAYAVCSNSLPLDHVRELTGDLPAGVHWIDATERVPAWLRPHLDGSMAEGVGWKLAPVRVFPDRYELALDNDCILWALPEALRVALEPGLSRCVLAEDVRPCLGHFAALGGNAPRNSGIRGTPPDFDLEQALRGTLERNPCLLASETDEQGLQVAALSACGAPLIVRTDEVSICSPFPPHCPEIGTCGAHFVGLNARALPWDYYGQPASDVRRAHWRTRRAALYERVGIAPDLAHTRRASA